MSHNDTISVEFVVCFKDGMWQKIIRSFKIEDCPRGWDSDEYAKLGRKAIKEPNIEHIFAKDYA